MAQVPRLQLGRAATKQGTLDNEEINDIELRSQNSMAVSVGSEKRKQRGEYKIHDREEDDD
jgi:hypothetical protein